MKKKISLAFIWLGLSISLVMAKPSEIIKIQRGKFISASGLNLDYTKIVGAPAAKKFKGTKYSVDKIEKLYEGASNELLLLINVKDEKGREFSVLYSRNLIFDKDASLKNSGTYRTRNNDELTSSEGETRITCYGDMCCRLEIEQPEPGGYIHVKCRCQYDEGECTAEMENVG